MKKTIIVLLIIVLILLTALGLLFLFNYRGQGNKNIGLANPASVNCKTAGGQLEIKNIDEGQIGICNFDDGSKCEEWSYFRDECQKGNKIVVYSPSPNQEISFPLTIQGEAQGDWFFEASFPVELLDEKNQLIAQTVAQTEKDWMTTEFIPFKAVLAGTSLSQSGLIPVTLVLRRDNPSGLPQNEEKISFPLIINQPQTTKINIYFGNSSLNPEVSDCHQVFASQRTVQKTQAIGRAAIEELLKGPTQEEKNQGYFTTINDGVKIQELTITNGTAEIDFNKQLESQVGGSCRVAAIRAQIEKTLKQFPTVKNVIISIDGRTEDILQP